MRRAARTVCLAALVSLAASMEAAAHDITIFGAGNSSCGSWIEAHKGAPTAIGASQKNWVFGYVAGFSSLAMGMGLPDATRAADVDGMTHWVTNYCVAHPLDTIYKAADALAGELIGRVTKR